MSPPNVPDPRAALDNPQPAPDFSQGGDPDRKRFGERPPFPRDGPVTPLGIWSGIDGTQRCYYLNWNGQLTGLEAGTKHGKNGLIALYGPTSEFLEDHWAQWSAPVYEGRGKARVPVKDPQKVGFNQAEASRCHIEACVARGIFNPQGRLRGRGANRLEDQRGMVLHCGDRIMISELTVEGKVKGYKWARPGLVGKYVYQADEPIPHPHPEPADTRPAETLLGLIRTWNWRRPLLDAQFVLGAIGAGMIGGALPWRPHIWITGGKGTGKSTLNGKDGLVHQLYGAGQFRTGNASAAGIRQYLKNSTLPVLFDEIEAGANNAQSNAVIELARVAASGDTMTRGAADHTAQEFTLQSCFWFSSINHPPLEPQDRSRLALLEVLPFAAGAVPPDFAAYNLADMGRRLLRRMVDGWWRLEATKRKFHLALAAAGHDNRACDQFGTLFACADILLHDWRAPGQLPTDEEVADWAAECRPERMAEITEATADHDACVIKLTTTLQQSRGGDPREAIGKWIIDAIGDDGLYDDGQDDKGHRERLQQLGLKLVNARYHVEVVGEDGKAVPAHWGAETFKRAAPGYLAVASTHQALAKIFEGSNWQGGVWQQSLKRIEHALPSIRVRFGAQPLRATLVPLSAMFDDEDLPHASRKALFGEWLAEQTSWGAD